MRRCTILGCGTILSRYNPGEVCWCHTRNLVDRDWGWRLTEEELTEYASGAWLGVTA